MPFPKSDLLKIGYEGHDDVWIDTVLAVRLFRRGLRIDFKDKDPYPWVIKVNSTSGWVIRLHRYSYNFGVEQDLATALKPGEDVHHHNGKKCDARLWNLRAKSRSAHSKLHHEKRQKHGYRKRFKNDLYKPQPSGPVIKRIEMVGQPGGTASPSSSFTSEAQLTGAFQSWVPWVREQVGHRDSTRKLPAQQHHQTPSKMVRNFTGKKTDKNARTKLPTMAITDEQAALLGYLVLHRQDFGAVCESVAQAMKLDAQEVAAVLKSWMHGAAFTQTKINWQEFRRLPKQISQRSWFQQDGDSQFPAGTWIRRGAWLPRGAQGGYWFRRDDHVAIQHVEAVDAPGLHALLWPLNPGLGLSCNLAVLCDGSQSTELFHGGRHWRFLDNGDRHNLLERYPVRWATTNGQIVEIGGPSNTRSGRLSLSLTEAQH